MIARIKALGLAAGSGVDVTHAARRVRAYVEGARPEAALSVYYPGADAVEGRGFGSLAPALALDVSVDGTRLEQLLRGVDPTTGALLLEDRSRRSTALRPDAGAWLDLTTAAAAAGVSVRHLRRLAEARPRLRFATPTVVRDPRVAHAVVEFLSGHSVDGPQRSWLAARRDSQGRWSVHRDELARFIAARPAPQRVMAFDLTLSAPKSVSLLWAFGDATKREAISTAFDAAINVAIGYLERHATAARVGGVNRPGEGLAVAAYRHELSRGEEPHLHTHCLIANVTQVVDQTAGATVWRALDSGLLLSHQLTAGYLAAATFRRELTARLGVEWSPVHQGVAELVGFPRPLLAHFSSRHRDIEQEYAALLAQGFTAGAATEVAAQESTRHAKRVRADADVLAAHTRRLAEFGWRPEQIETLGRGFASPRPVAPSDVERVVDALCGPTGLTERVAQFDRQQVVRELAVRLGDRLDATTIDDLAGRVLLDDRVVACLPAATGRRHQQRAARYTTVELLAVEDSLLSLLRQGQARQSGLVRAAVDGTVVGQMLARWAGRLSDEQLDAVSAVVRSGDLLRVLVGPAGSGKTEAMRAAVEVWQRCGYEVVGAANGGRQAQQLDERLGVASEVVASWLTRLDHAYDPTTVWPSGTVVLLDEATQVSTRDAERLARYATRGDTVLVALGDPGQLSSVGAGGWFRHLAADDGVAVVRELHRQAGGSMSSVRAALQALRSQLPGRVDDALALLEGDGRVRVCEDRAALLGAVVEDWYADRQTPTENVERDWSVQRVRMLAALQRDVDVLNRAARVRLAADGTLRGDGVEVAGREFRVGDEVVTLSQRGHTIVPDGANPRGYIRTGTIGTIVEVHRDARVERQWLRVDFGRRGIATVPQAYLDFDFGDGRRGGLAHAYALTADRSQGSTMHAARTVATDATSRQALYVMLSRGRRDVAAYVIRRRDLEVDPSDESWLPVLADGRSAMERLAARLKASRPERLAGDLDPDAAAAHALATQYSLAQLTTMRTAALTSAELPASIGLARRAELLAEERVAAAAVLSPPERLVRTLGRRPDRGAARRAWDAAIGADAVFTARHAPTARADRDSEDAWAAVTARAERLLQGCIDRARVPQCPPAVRAAVLGELVGLLAAHVDATTIARELLFGPVRDGRALLERARVLADAHGVDGRVFRSSVPLSRAGERARCVELVAEAQQVCGIAPQPAPAGVVRTRGSEFELG